MAYKQLTDEQRYQIEALKREGFTQAAIAQSIGTSPSTISRELRRNSDSKGGRSLKMEVVELWSDKKLVSSTSLYKKQNKPKRCASE